MDHRLIVIEQRHLVRDWLTLWLSPEFPDTTAVNGVDALAELDLTDRVAICGPADWRDVRSQYALPIIVIADSRDEVPVGVQGVIITNTDPKVAFAAIRLVFAGGKYLHTSTVPTIVDRGKLTSREQVVFALMCDGVQNKIIAYKMSISVSTVKAHVHSIIHKLKVRNRTEAVSQHFAAQRMAA